MSSPEDLFINAVKRFCAWVEQPHHELLDVRQHLLALITPIPQLQEKRHNDLSESKYLRRGHEGWQEDIQRFSDLPFRTYLLVFDPFDFDASEEPVKGDLHDDLADIYGDLWNGLQAYAAGDINEAFFLWIDAYFYHWGRHATSALNTIDAFYRLNQSS